MAVRGESVQLADLPQRCSQLCAAALWVSVLLDQPTQLTGPVMTQPLAPVEGKWCSSNRGKENCPRVMAAGF